MEPKVNTSPAFGKYSVMSCQVKDVKSKENNSATLYKLNTDDGNDANDVRYSKTAQAIRDDFFDAYYHGNNYKNFYLLQNDKTGEVISCAQTSWHYRNGDIQNPGFSTVIEQLSENDKYVNSGEPMLAYIINDASIKGFESVYSVSTPSNQSQAVARAKFSKTENEGITFMPQKSFLNFLDGAEKRSKIDYIL